MPYDVWIDEAARAIVVKASGRGSTAETLQLISAQGETFREYAGYSLLYDASELEIDSSPSDMIKVGTALFEGSGAAFGRIAIVVPSSREELARMFTALAHPFGVTANVFTDVADARAWLGCAATIGKEMPDESSSASPRRS